MGSRNPTQGTYSNQVNVFSKKSMNRGRMERADDWELSLAPIHSCLFWCCRCGMGCRHVRCLPSSRCIRSSTWSTLGKAGKPHVPHSPWPPGCTDYLGTIACLLGRYWVQAPEGLLLHPTQPHPMCSCSLTAVTGAAGAACFALALT